MNDVVAFGRLVGALQAWNDRVVIVGGWAHRLHRFHPDADASSVAYAPLTTKDADVAFGDARRMRGDIGLALMLAGFEQKLSGDRVPPVSRFEFTRDASGFYVEFLSPLRGSGVRRDGSVDATETAAGVTTQKLRHLESLLVAPWSLKLKAGEAIPVEFDCTILAAIPVSFVIQKLLIHRDRSARKRPQDILYIHDTIDLFAGALDRLHTTWTEVVAPSLTRKQRDLVCVTAAELFRHLTDDIRNAARIPADRRLTADDVRRRCLMGCEELLSQ